MTMLRLLASIAISITFILGVVQARGYPRITKRQVSYQEPYNTLPYNTAVYPTESTEDITYTTPSYVNPVPVSNYQQENIGNEVDYSTIQPLLMQYLLAQQLNAGNVYGNPYAAGNPYAVGNPYTVASASDGDASDLLGTLQGTYQGINPSLLSAGQTKYTNFLPLSGLTNYGTETSAYSPVISPSSYALASATYPQTYPTTTTSIYPTTATYPTTITYPTDSTSTYPSGSSPLGVLGSIG